MTVSELADQREHYLTLARKGCAYSCKDGKVWGFGYKGQFSEGRSGRVPCPITDEHQRTATLLQEQVEKIKDSDPVTTAERDKYARVWKDPSYRVKNHALQLWTDRRDLFPRSFASGLDIGCGLGRLLPVWEALGIDVYGVDLVPEVSLEPAIRVQLGHKVYTATLWDFHPMRQFDVGICADVMEHIPETHVSAVLDCLAACCREVLFLIANFRSIWGDQTLHLTRHDAAWWEAALGTSLSGTVTSVPYTAPGGRQLKYLFRWVRHG